MISLEKQIDFNEKYLIIPSVSVGNVGQLACDLLITNLQMQKLGRVWSSALLPMVGVDPYDTNSNEISTACELYYQPDGGNIVLFQIRTGLNSLAMKFLKELEQFIADKHFKQVILLTSCFAYEQHNIESTPYRYVCSKEISLPNWLSLDYKDKLEINGGGFALKLYELLNSNNIEVLLVLKYCSEGDNIPDCIALLKYLNDYLPILTKFPNPIRYPPSWQLLFGGPPPKGIY